MSVSAIRLSASTTMFDSVNSTSGSDNISYIDLSRPQFMSADERDIALFIFKVKIYPIIGVIGLAGNIISGIVLKRTGLNQPSNIFLLVLAVADSGVLIWAIDISGIIPFVTGVAPGIYYLWEFSHSISVVFFYIYVIILVISRMSQKISATITLVIAIERLIAVFLPLKFPTIVTKSRAWYAMAVTVLFWLSLGSLEGFFHKLSSIQFTNGQIFWKLANSDFYTNNKVIQYLWSKVMIHFSHTIPLILVTASCVILFVKISTTRRKRRKLMTSSAGQKTSSTQTSITLLLVCSVYSLARIIYLLDYLPIFEITDIYWQNLALVYYNFRDACNFFIYVMFNPKFRTTLKTLFLQNAKNRK